MMDLIMIRAGRTASDIEIHNPDSATLVSSFAARCGASQAEIVYINVQEERILRLGKNDSGSQNMIRVSERHAFETGSIHVGGRTSDLIERDTVGRVIRRGKLSAAGRDADN